MNLLLGTDDPLRGVVSVALFLFFAMMLSVPQGYTAGVALLFATSLYFVVRHPDAWFSRCDCILLATFAAVFLTSLVSWVYHGDSIRSLDLPFRYLLVIPVFWLLLAHPPRWDWIWGGMVLGCIGAAGVAGWQKFMLLHERAFGFTGGIQFGDLAMTMGMFCLVGLLWARQLARNSCSWQAALLCGAACGVYASVLSGTRGAWVTVPVVAIIVYIAFVNKRNWKLGAAALLVCAFSLAVAVKTIPILQDRYQLVVSDLDQFQKGNAETSLGMRFEMWEALALIIPQRPLMGWSEAEYDKERERLLQEGKVSAVIFQLANTHNTFLQVWLQRGLFGLIPLAVMLVTALVYFVPGLRHQDRQVQVFAIAGTALVTSFIVFGQTQIILGRNNTLLFFLVTLVMLWAGKKQAMRSGVSRRMIAPGRSGLH